MRESDPRPMPEQIRRAYAERTQLAHLLNSKIFRPSDRVDIRDALLEQLTRDHGVAETVPRSATPWSVYASKDPDRKKPERKTTRKLVTLEERVMPMKDVMRAINIILHADDYGGPETTLPYLARLMEPYWQRWWILTEWSNRNDVANWAYTTDALLGVRQYTWIAAQCARFCSDKIPQSFRAEQLILIRDAELWAESPETTRVTDPWPRYGNDYGPGGYAKLMTTSRAPTVHFIASIMASADVSNQWYGYDHPYAYMALSDLMKKLFAPSLLDPSYEIIPYSQRA